jgi:D-amino-acid dehydrogenase
VVVVGGGVIGLCCAYWLQAGGAEVVVLERRRIGSGASGANAGWICPILSGPLPAPALRRAAWRLLSPGAPIRIRGPISLDMASWLWTFWRRSTGPHQMTGVHAMARLARDSMALYEAMALDGVPLDMTSRGIMAVFLDRTAATEAMAGLAPMAEHGFVPPDRLLEGSELQTMEPALTERVRAAFVLSGEKHLRPESFLRGLARTLIGRGVDVREDVAVEGFEPARGTIRRLLTSSGPVEAEAAVLAAGVWTRRLARLLGASVPVVAGSGHSFTIVPTALPSRPLYLEEARLACTPMGDRLRVAGTVDLGPIRDGVDTRRVGRMVRSAALYLRGVDPGAVREAWTGPRPVAPDGLPVIGPLRMAGDVFVATGHATLGMTLGPPTGRALAEAILTGIIPEVLAPFSPNRF